MESSRTTDVLPVWAASRKLHKRSEEQGPAGQRSAQLGIPKTATTAIANAMPVNKATQPQFPARQARAPDQPDDGACGVELLGVGDHELTSVEWQQVVGLAIRVIVGGVAPGRVSRRHTVGTQAETPSARGRIGGSSRG